MRDNVTFVHPAPFIGLTSDGDDGILAVAGAHWFAELLRRIPGLDVQAELCQEDWGVVVFASRGPARFWIGLSVWPDLPQGWLAHLHVGPFSILEHLRGVAKAGRAALPALAGDLHRVLSTDAAVSGITWYREKEMGHADPPGAPTPGD
jgi:hypothetical protein